MNMTISKTILDLRLVKEGKSKVLGVRKTSTKHPVSQFIDKVFRFYLFLRKVMSKQGNRCALKSCQRQQGTSTDCADYVTAYPAYI